MTKLFKYFLISISLLILWMSGHAQNHLEGRVQVKVFSEELTEPVNLDGKYILDYEKCDASENQLCATYTISTSQYPDYLVLHMSVNKREICLDYFSKTGFQGKRCFPLNDFYPIENIFGQMKYKQFVAKEGLPVKIIYRESNKKYYLQTFSFSTGLTQKSYDLIIFDVLLH